MLCRNKIRLQLAEAINMAAGEVPEGDAGARAAEVESAVLAAHGAVNPRYGKMTPGSEIRSVGPAEGGIDHSMQARPGEGVHKEILALFGAIRPT